VQRLHERYAPASARGVLSHALSFLVYDWSKKRNDVLVSLTLGMSSLAHIGFNFAFYPAPSKTSHSCTSIRNSCFALIGFSTIFPFRLIGLLDA
jgi:hypothetical protein